MIRSLIKTSFRTIPYLILPQMNITKSIRFDMAKVSKKDQQRNEKKKQKQHIKQSLGGNIKQVDLNKYEQSYNSVILAFKEQLSSIRVGRLQVASIMKVQCKIGSHAHLISEIAQVSAKGANSCVVSPFDSSQIQGIEKSLKIWDDSLQIKKQDNSLLLTQLAQGKQVREKLIQHAKKICNDRREQLKNLRSKTQDQLRKYKKVIPEDRFRTIESEAKVMFDKKNQQIDKIQKEKEKELLK